MSSIQKKGVENNTHTVLDKANGNKYPHQALGLKVAGHHDEQHVKLQVHKDKINGAQRQD